MGKFIDLSGEKFGKLTVLRRENKMWLCVCDCGNEKTIDGGHLKSGHTKSCGCFQREQTLKAHTKHGNASLVKKSPEYYIWSGMKKRCMNPKNSKYEYYGGRGISVCERWLSFENFLADMGKRPSPGHSIDRIDVNGNYEKSNCRWSTKIEQSQNQRIRKDNCTGQRGVFWDKIIESYVANISVNRKRIRLGSTKSLEEAVKLRVEGEKRYW